MKKLTTKEFIERAKQTHGNKYDYSKVDYINAQTKVCIICPEHGEFWSKPYNHLNGSKCPLCNRHKWDTESFIKEAIKVHGDKYDYSKVEYVSTRDKICIICPEHGEFWQYPLLHLEGMGCRYEKRGKNIDKWEDRVCPICGSIFNVRKKVKKITCSPDCLKEYCLRHKEEIGKKISKKVKKAFAAMPQELKNKSREKARNTCLERYGVDNFSKTKIGRELSSKSMKKYRKIVDDKYKNEILIPKYTKLCEDDDLELIEFRNRFDCLVRCKKCNEVFTTKTLGYLTDSTVKNRCRKCHPIEFNFQNTKQETEFEQYLIENNINYKKHSRSLITPLEIDFYLTDYNIAIEFNGIYWHSEINKDSNYHIEKTIKCENKGIKLIHFYEDEWDNKRESCLNILNTFINDSYDNRKLSIKIINEKEIIKDFLINNTLQVYRNFSVGYGIYDGDILNGIITFKKRGINDCDIVNISFKNKINLNIIKNVLDDIKIKYNFKQIFLSLDRRFENIDLYRKIFSFQKEITPNFYYVIKHKREDRNHYKKKILVEKYNCPKNKSEHEFCLENKWYRIYDCGRIILSY